MADRSKIAYTESLLIVCCSEVLGSDVVGSMFTCRISMPQIVNLAAIEAFRRYDEIGFDVRLVLQKALDDTINHGHFMYHKELVGS